MAGVKDKTEDKGRPAPMGRGGHKRRDTGLPAREDGPRGTPPGRARGSRAEKPRRPTPDSFRPGTPRFDREELKRLPTLAHCDRTKELRRDAPFLGAARRRPLHGPGRFRVRRGREGGPGGDGAAAPTERSTRTAPAAPSPSEGSGRRGTRRAPPRRFAATAAVPTAFGARSGRSPRRAAALTSKDPRPPPFAHARKPDRSGLRRPPRRGAARAAPGPWGGRARGTSSAPGCARVRPRCNRGRQRYASPRSLGGGRGGDRGVPGRIAPVVAVASLPPGHAPWESGGTTSGRQKETACSA